MNDIISYKNNEVELSNPHFPTRTLPTASSIAQIFRRLDTAHSPKILTLLQIWLAFAYLEKLRLLPDLRKETFVLLVDLAYLILRKA